MFVIVNMSYARAKVSVGRAYQGMTSAKMIKPAHLSKHATTNFDIILKPRNKAELFKNAESVNTLGTANFKQFITPNEFTKKYGQPQSVIRVCLKTI
jgi:subtilase family serine protease